ncbi:MAG: ABC transporter ATP-binding protein, partial [Planctomicrobium sp.]|nr:ABC transporter ATP-binding protein [Planctomicrobium sp.]
ADEPTGNLDQENAETLLEYLEEFASEGGAVLLVTHDDRAVAHAQRVIHLMNGKVVTPAAVG